MPGDRPRTSWPGLGDRPREAGGVRPVGRVAARWPAWSPLGRGVRFLFLCVCVCVEVESSSSEALPEGEVGVRVGLRVSFGTR